MTVAGARYPPAGWIKKEEGEEEEKKKSTTNSSDKLLGEGGRCFQKKLGLAG
jgi:hypothetical protein